MAIRAVVWGENVHEQKNRVVAATYPQGMHQAIADAPEPRTRPSRPPPRPCRSPSTACPQAASRRRTSSSGGATPPTRRSRTRSWSAWPRPSGPAWA
jgi:hypothetical protein